VSNHIVLRYGTNDPSSNITKAREDRSGIEGSASSGEKENEGRNLHVTLDPAIVLF
jgi:hypothetical protein